MGGRRDRIDKRNAAATSTRRKNSARKTAERTRREESMLAILKQGQFPYTPGVMSWLSERLDKKASRITPADVKALLKQG
ncbi:hypothetical protein ACFL02_01525 [Planctomycetota bacterium]